MALVLYRRQKQILGFINQYIATNGAAPTLRQIADAIGVSSLATIHEHLGALEEKKLIKRSSGKNRSIELTSCDIESGIEKAIEVPILGYIAAGTPIEPFIDPNASMSIPPAMITSKKRVYVLQVRGDSMIEDQIRDGDFVIIEETEDAQNGQIVVALLPNGMATLKRFFKEATRVRLEPANSTMSPIFAREVKIQGKVVGLVRKYLVN